MKKCYFILGLILATSTATAAVDQNMKNTYRNRIDTMCWEILNEDGPVAKQAEAKKFCKNVANCVVDGITHPYQFQDTNYLQISFMSCLADEARKIK